MFMLLVMILFFHVLASIPISICYFFVCKSVGQVLKFTIAAAHKIDVIGKL